MEYNEIKEKLNKMGYELLDDIYVNNKNSLNLRKDGYYYSTSWNCLIKSKNPKKWGINNKYSIENINNYFIKNNINCKVVSEKYNPDKMEFECYCGSKFFSSLRNLLNSGNGRCRKCNIAIRNKKHIKYDYLEKLKELGLFYLKDFDDFSGVKNYDFFKTNDGYICRISPYCVISSKNVEKYIWLSIFTTTNPYLIYNIENFIKLKNLNVTLENKNIKSLKDNVFFRCKCGNVFETSFYYFITNLKQTCETCSVENRKVKLNEFEKDKNVKYVEEDEETINKKSYFIDSFGYYLKLPITNKPLSIIENENCFCKFHNNNKYLKDNILNYIYRNKPNDILLNISNAINKNGIMSNSLEIQCKCGEIYNVKMNNYIKGNNNCIGCSKREMSKMENFVVCIFNEYNIKYCQQKRFEDCRNFLPLPFDFYIPDKNICIECQGKQHFEPIEYFGGEENFKNTIYNDSIKEQYCLNNNIKLIYMTYLQFKDKENFKNKLLSLISE